MYSQTQSRKKMNRSVLDFIITGAQFTELLLVIPVTCYRADLSASVTRHEDAPHLLHCLV